MIDNNLKEQLMLNGETSTLRGNTIHRGFWGDSDRARYYFDTKVCTKESGWKQYDTDQDAWYFGVWVHIEKRLVFTFAEGDTSLVECDSVEALRAELKHMAEFYGPPPRAFRIYGFDADDTGRNTLASITDVYDIRPEV